MPRMLALFSLVDFLVPLSLAATPAYKSSYCDDHLHFACDSRDLTGKEDKDSGELDVPIGPVLRSAQKQVHGESIVEIIVAKKVTRQQTYYKVCLAIIIVCYV